MSDQQKEIDKNYEEFKKLLPSLRNESGKYALMRHGNLIGIYDTFRDAFQTATTFYDDEHYSIQQVTSHPVDLGFRSRALPRR